MPGLPGKPLTATDRRLLAEARKSGRAKSQQRKDELRVVLEPKLLKATNRAAQRGGVSPTEWVARALRAALVVQAG